MRCTSLFAFFCCALLLSATAALSAQSPSGDKDAGATLFRETGCAHCHGTNLAGTKKGPSLLGIKNNRKWPAEKMRDQILNGGEKMPPFADSLSDEEINQLITYLQSTTSPNASAAISNPPK